MKDIYERLEEDLHYPYRPWGWYNMNQREDMIRAINDLHERVKKMEEHK